MIRDMAGRIVRYDDPRVVIRERARAAQFAGPEVFEAEAVAVAPAPAVARPCPCGCNRLVESRAWMGFAYGGCLARGEER
jgi:hypothetical protein